MWLLYFAVFGSAFRVNYLTLHTYIPLLMVPRKTGNRDLMRLSTEFSVGRELSHILTTNKLLFEHQSLRTALTPENMSSKSRASLKVPEEIYYAHHVKKGAWKGVR